MGELISGGRWLNAHEDRSAGLSPLHSRCITLCDASGSGDYVLVVVEPRITNVNQQDVIINDNANSNYISVSGRMRIYRGAASLNSERPLQGPPSAVLALYTDDLEPKVPAVAVAIGTDILIYKNSKPFFKWSTPPLSTTAHEQDIWRRLIAPDGLDSASISSHIATLNTIPFNQLSPRSQRLLIIDNHEEFIGRYIHSEPPMFRPSPITCLATLNKTSENLDSVACLVLATEHGQLYILDPVAFSCLQQTAIHRGYDGAPTIAPAYLTCSGLYDVEFRCWVGLRDGSVWMIRRGWLEGRKWCQAPQGATILDILVHQDNNLLMALTDGRLIAWNKKGKILWTIQSNNATSFSCLCLVPLPHLNLCLTAVGVGNQLRLFDQRTLVDTIHLPDRPVAVRFGRLGQEDNVFVIITLDGSLLLKILKRTAEFSADTANSETTINNLSTRPLPLPKRSKLFAEQAQRERNNAQAMHQIFQQGLIRLRLTAARNTIMNIRTATKNVSDSTTHPIKLSAQVLGLGPKFTLTLTIENLSPDKAVSDLSVLLHTSILKYQIEQAYSQIPMIPPELNYKIETSVLEILNSTQLDVDDENEDVIPIRVFITIPKQIQPLLAATINMPPTDPLAFLI